METFAAFSKRLCHSFVQSVCSGYAFPHSTDAHVYGAAFGLLVGPNEHLELQVPAECPSMVGDAERGLRNFLVDGKCLYFPSIAMVVEQSDGVYAIKVGDFIRRPAVLEVLQFAWIRQCWRAWRCFDDCERN